MEWARNYFNVDAPIILFTSPELSGAFAQMRSTKPIHIVSAPFEELDAWKLYKSNWTGESAQLYALCTQTSFFVQRAWALNPFHATHMVWCDIGTFREPVHPTIIASFPRASPHLAADTVLMCAINPITDDDSLVSADGITGATTATCVDHFVGNLWGSGRVGCDRWHAAYVTMLDRYFAADRFVGTGQSVMTSAWLEDTTLACIVRPTRQDIAPRVFLPHLLSDMPVEYALEDTYAKYASGRHIISIMIMGGLGNQMFQIAVAYAHARANGGTLRLLRNKLNADGRSMYWDSVLRRCVSYLTDHLPPVRPYDEVTQMTYTQIPAPSGAQLLKGYFQAGEYFSAQKPAIRALFASAPETLDKIRIKYDYFLENRERVVVVHARRTDYCKNPEIIAFHGPLPTTYYDASTKNMCGRIEKPIFLLCSDDPSYWVTSMPYIESLHTNEFHILSDEDDVTTLALLQQFHYFIMANSTFSWWAVWLAKAPRHVIAPAKWFGPTGVHPHEGIYESAWEKM
jgi:hypothetical protein